MEEQTQHRTLFHTVHDVEKINEVKRDNQKDEKETKKTVAQAEMLSSQMQRKKERVR